MTGSLEPADKMDLEIVNDLLLFLLSINVEKWKINWANCDK